MVWYGTVRSVGTGARWYSCCKGIPWDSPDTRIGHKKAETLWKLLQLLLQQQQQQQQQLEAVGGDSLLGGYWYWYGMVWYGMMKGWYGMV